jgi:hypothetical protein
MAMMSWFLAGRGAPPGLLEPLFEIGTVVEHAPTKFEEDRAHALAAHIFQCVLLEPNLLRGFRGCDEF